MVQYEVGTCQAIEDAYALGKLYLLNRDFSDIFSIYEKLRMGKARKITRNLWRAGKIAHFKNPLMIGLRMECCGLFRIHGKHIPCVTFLMYLIWKI